MISWDGAGQVIWNVGAVAVFFVAAAALVSPRSRGLRRGWRSKVLWFVSLGLFVSVDGFYVPLGPILVFVQITQGWRELEPHPS